MVSKGKYACASLASLAPLAQGNGEFMRMSMLSQIKILQQMARIFFNCTSFWHSCSKSSKVPPKLVHHASSFTHPDIGPLH